MKRIGNPNIIKHRTGRKSNLQLFPSSSSSSSKPSSRSNNIFPTSRKKPHALSAKNYKVSAAASSGTNARIRKKRNTLTLLSSHTGIIYALVGLSLSIIFVGVILGFYALILSNTIDGGVVSGNPEFHTDIQIIQDFPTRRVVEQQVTTTTHLDVNNAQNNKDNLRKGTPVQKKEKKIKKEIARNNDNDNEPLVKHVEKKEEGDNANDNAANAVSNNDELHSNQAENTIIDTNEYFFASSDLKDPFWGHGISRGWAELPFAPELIGKTAQLQQTNPLVMSVWIYLKRSDTNEKTRILFTSRKTDTCTTNPEEKGQHTSGIRLAVEGSQSRYLVFEYSDNFIDYSPCYRFETEGHHPSIPLNKWTHIGLIFSQTSSSSSSNSIDTIHVHMYLNGVLVLDAKKEKELLHAKSMRQKPVQTITRIGQSFQGKEFLDGHLAMLAIWMGTTSVEKKSLNSMMREVFRSGINKDKIMNLGSGGLTKAPTYLYTFLKDDEFLKQVESPLKEVMQQKNGQIFQGIQIDTYQPLGGLRYLEYKDGTKVVEPTREETGRSDHQARIRRLHIREAMQRTWISYQKYAFGKDKFLPLKKEGQNDKGGMGTFLINSIDTLYIMDLIDEFNEAKEWIASHLTFESVGMVSVYEVTTQHLGGLLAAYDLTKDKMFAKKADEIAFRLIAAFESASGLPNSQITLNSGRSFNLGMLGNKIVLSEVGSILLEFRYLSKITRKTIYARKANKIYDVFGSSKNTLNEGLFPVLLGNDVVQPAFGSTDRISLGTMGGSFYEGLLKTFMQGGKYELKYRRMFDKSMNKIVEVLLHKSKPNGLTYVAELNYGKIEHQMDSSACFLPGILALGAVTNQTGIINEHAARDLKIAKALAYTCYQIYAQTLSGLSPESVIFEANSKQDFTTPNNAAFHLIRPQFAQSLYILYTITRDPVYRDWGWEIFQSIEKFCRADVSQSYATLKDVNDVNKGVDNRLETYFTATLKYLYLLHDPDSEFDVLGKHVFNAEGHPLKTLSLVKEIRGFMFN